MTDERVQHIKETMTMRKYGYQITDYEKYYERLAVGFHSLYEKLMNVGFNEDQAMKILIATIQNTK